jgi:hypothetical protein
MVGIVALPTHVRLTVILQIDLRNPGYPPGVTGPAKAPLGRLGRAERAGVQPVLFWSFVARRAQECSVMGHR